MKEKVKVGGYIRTIPLGVVKVKKRILTKDGKLVYVVHTKANPQITYNVPNSLCKWEADKEDYK